MFPVLVPSCSLSQTSHRPQLNVVSIRASCECDINVSYKTLWSSASALWSWRLRSGKVPSCLYLHGNDRQRLSQGNNDFLLSSSTCSTNSCPLMTDIHNRYRDAFKAVWQMKAQRLNKASPLVSTRSMHFLTKLKPASLRNAATWHENKVDTSVAVWLNRVSCRNNHLSPMHCALTNGMQPRRCEARLCQLSGCMSSNRVNEERYSSCRWQIMSLMCWCGLYLCFTSMKRHLLSSFLLNMAGRL